MDIIVAILADAGEPDVTAAQDSEVIRGTNAEAFVLRPGRPRTDRRRAAIANAIAGNGAQLDPGYRNFACHAGLYVVPPLLAEGEAEGMAWGDLLDVATLAYEVTIRCAASWPIADRTIYPPALYGAIGAAAALGLARATPPHGYANLLAIAHSFANLGPYRLGMDGSTVSNLWNGLAMESAFRALDWAQAGFIAPLDTPYDVFVRALGTTAAPECLDADLGHRWALEQGYHKRLAACQYAHAAMEAAAAILADWQGTPDDVTAILIETGPLGLTLDFPEPQTGLGTRFSLQYCVAAVLARRSTAPAVLGAASLTDPAIRMLSQRTKLAAFSNIPPPPRDRPARVSLHLVDGTVLTRVCLSVRSERA